MNKKIDNLKDLEYYGNIELLATTVLEALKKAPTEKLEAMSRAITQITFYVNNLQTDRRMYDKAMSEYRADKNRAVMRARAAEKKAEELEQQLKNFNIFKPLKQ
jgi:hypothetical protein|tara:strand:+ start:485 stop:796 length:312 start_codon:yes stop_codon:yes gene_type:complete